jgi:YD repeat-containing protein
MCAVRGCILPKAFIYIRFSTKQQDKGVSGERQLELCTEHCRRQGWEIVETIEDLGRSAWKGHHLSSGNLGRFADRVRAGEIEPGSILVVEQLDRLSRLEATTTLRWLQDLAALGLRVATVEGSNIFDKVSLRGEEGLISILQILLRSQTANQESDVKSTRMRDVWERKQEDAKSNVVMTTQCPAWLRVKDDRSGFDEIKERGDIVRQIYQWSADGLGSRAIATKLNDAGVKQWGKTWSATSKPGWQASYITRILAAPQVEGDYIPRTVRNVPQQRIAYYPRVVNADLVARARAAIPERKHTGGYRRVAFKNLFMGLTLCAGCGGKMEMRTPSGNVRASAQARRGYLSCSNAVSKRGCDRRQMFAYGPFEDAALEAVLHRALDDKFFQRPDQTVQLAIDVAELEKKVADQKSQATNLVRLLARMDVPEVEEELASVTSATRVLEAQLADTVKSLEAARGQVSPQEHLQRVLEVRAALQHEDQEAREAARMKVHEAMKGVVDQVRCDAFDCFTGQPQKTMTLILVGGVMAFKFDNAGKLLATTDATGVLRKQTYVVDGQLVSTNPEAGRRGITGGDKRQEAKLDGMLRRQRAAK